MGDVLRTTNVSGKATRRLLPALLVATGLLTAGSAAAAAVVLHGRGSLVSEPLTGDLQVVGARLEPLLVPGNSADLIVDLRNRSGLTLATDQVRLILPLSDARPAGCVAKVSGPLLARNGLTLTGDQRITIAPGSTGQVVVPAALSLARSASGGCGFKVQVDVRAVQAPPNPSPSATSPTPPPPTSPNPSPSIPDDGGVSTDPPPPNPSASFPDDGGVTTSPSATPTFG